MDLSSNLSALIWLELALVFITGIAIGAIGYHFIHGSKNGAGRLHKRIKSLESELESYKTKVNDHFVTTAGIINRLTESYREVHQHLAMSADKLCDDEVIQHHFQDALLSTNSLLSTESSSAGNDIEKLPDTPPKDYAPHHTGTTKSL